MKILNRGALLLNILRAKQKINKQLLILFDEKTSPTTLNNKIVNLYKQSLHTPNRTILNISKLDKSYEKQPVTRSLSTKAD